MSYSLSSIPSTSSAAVMCIAAPKTPVADGLSPTETLEDPTEESPTSIPSDESPRGAVGNVCKRTTICRYFLRGTCQFGAECRFLHCAMGGEVISSSHNGSVGNAYGTLPSSTSPSLSKLANWAEAPAFIPNTRTVFQTQTEVDPKDRSVVPEIKISGNFSGTAPHNIFGCFPSPGSVTKLCPYKSPCPFGANCFYALHMEPCKMCDQYCLHPTDLEQRRQHNHECLQLHEQEMEQSFAIARSKGKICGICMDIVLEKTSNKRRFGILPNCNHVFCLACIRKWRQTTAFSNKVIRSCPECRTASDFVCPSPFWVETKEQKDKLISEYRAALALKDCKYFKEGNGKCPFGNKCFYRHALPSGEQVDVGCPHLVQKVKTSRLFEVYFLELVEQRDYLELLSNESDNSDLDSVYSHTN